MAGPILDITGVTFTSVQAALTDLYFRFDGMTQKQFDDARKYVVPMQHNFESPLKPGSGDTIIQYWIGNDDRLTKDWKDGNISGVMKVATITIRFIGVQGEQWAKAFHHLAQRRQVVDIFSAYCNATYLEYIGPIVATNIDYFGAANATKAFTITLKLHYNELLDFTKGSGGDDLEYISFAPGQITKTNT